MIPVARTTNVFCAPCLVTISEERNANYSEVGNRLLRASECIVHMKGRNMRRAIGLLVASLAFSVIPLTAATAGPEPSITFDGAGWGHGVGMSQYGAYGRAIEGQTYSEILAAYYTDSTIGQLGVGAVPDPGNIFTNVASDRTTTTLTVLNGPAEPHTGMVVTRLTGEPTPPTATLGTNDKISIVDTTPDAGAPGGCTATLTISGVDTVWETGPCDFTVALTSGDEVPSQVIQATNCRTANCTFGYGTALYLVDNGSAQRSNTDRVGGCASCPEFPGFDIVVETTLDEYTRGIAEVPYSWPTETLKTQAVAARSYAASFVLATDNTAAGCFCDVLNTSSYQVYAGWVGGWTLNSAWDAAATTTAGEVVTHPAAPNAGIVRAYYSSSNGGASEWVKEKWTADLPYLVSVPDPYSLVSINPRASWSFTKTSSEVVDAVWGTSADYTLTGATVVARNVSGSAKTIRFEALAPGDQPVTKDLPVGTVTSKFGLYSWYFDIDDSGLVTTPPSGAATVGVQDPRTGIWSLRMSDGSIDEFYYGDPNDIPFVGDWNGDGVETVGLYRKSVGFLFLRYTNTQGIADVDIYYGIPGDVPIAGDWDGDGVDTIGIYRPSEARFYLRNTNTQGIADIDLAFGNVGDVPLAGDWDGDGKDTIGVYRPSTKMVYLTDSIESGAISVSFAYSGAVSGDRVIAGDWNDDGVDTLGVFRPSTSTFYLRDTFTQTSANISFTFGSSWENPIAGSWGG
jgi:SpoIID/LytB domain protein